MQKVLNFLEKNVQWVAIGLGVLFLGWMVYKYAINPPLKVDVGGTMLNPGEVDRHINDNDASKLRAAMETPPRIDNTPPTNVTALVDEMKKPVQVAALNFPTYPAQTIDAKLPEFTSQGPRIV